MKREEPSKLRNPQSENRDFEFVLANRKLCSSESCVCILDLAKKFPVSEIALYPTQKSRVLKSIQRTIFIQTCAGHIRDIPLCV